MIIWQEPALVCDDLVEAAEQFTQDFAPLIVKAAAVKPLSDVVRLHGQMPGACRVAFSFGHSAVVRMRSVVNLP